MANQFHRQRVDVLSTPNTLGKRLFLRTVIVVVLILASMLALEFSISSSRNVAAARNDLIRRIDSIEPNIIQALWRIDAETIRTAVRSIAANPGVTFVSLRAQFRINDVNERYVRPGSNDTTCDDRIIRDYSDKLYQGLRIASGVLNVCFNPDLVKIPEPFSVAWPRVVTTVGVAIIVAAILFWIIRRSVLAPINQMTARIRENRLASDEPLHRDTWDRGDELDQLYVELSQAMQMAERNHIDDKLRSLGLLASGVAHDMNNVLGVALGHAELLRNMPESPNKVYERADTIVRAVKNASTVVGRLMYLSSANKSTRSILSVTSFMDAMKSFAKLLLRNDVAIEFSNTTKSSLYLDVGGLQAAAINIILNANDELEGQDNGAIRINAYETITNKIPEVCIEVSDNGRGMSSEVLKDAIKPFFTTKSKGSGLGLTMVADYVAKMDGRLSITSNEGSGTTVCMCFPTATTADVYATPGMLASTTQQTPQKSLRVLIVDDNFDYAALLKGQVEQLGHYAQCITDPSTILASTEKYAAYDVIISDVFLGSITGQDLYSHMQQRLGDNCPPVIFISGASEDEVPIDALHAPEKRIFAKPFELFELRDAINELAAYKAQNSADHAPHLKVPSGESHAPRSGRA